MRSKAPLVLMEQIIMLLVFSIAAAICVRVFIAADQISLSNELRDRAIIQVQTISEVYKEYNGNKEKVVNNIGGSIKNEKWVTYWDSRWEIANKDYFEYKIEVKDIKSEIKGLGKAEVSAYDVKNKKILNLQIAWQEGLER